MTDVPDDRLWPNRLRLTASLLEELASPDYQRRQWIEGEDPNVLSTREETFAMLLCDFDLAETVRLSIRHHGWTTEEEVADRLERLRALMLALPPSFPLFTPGVEVVPSPEWRPVVEGARLALAALRARLP